MWAKRRTVNARRDSLKGPTLPSLVKELLTRDPKVGSFFVGLVVEDALRMKESGLVGRVVLKTWRAPRQARSIGALFPVLLIPHSLHRLQCNLC